MKHLFVRKPGEAWPPRWILFLCLLAVLLSSLYNATLLVRTESRAAHNEAVAVEQNDDKVKLAKLVLEETCANGQAFEVDNRNLCAEAKQQAGETDPPVETSTSGTPLVRDGKDGRDGLDGLPGERGPKGDKGDKGDTGDDGAIGLLGPGGLDGSQGPPGPQGEPGVPGQDGQPGAPGQDGRDGQDGAPGQPPTKLTFTDGTTCAPTSPGSTEYQCDGPAPSPLKAP